jgi:UDP-N-acetylmuramoyl-L-alanyl-D-glutamate--2,6-diaminopimelate ligase
MRRRQLKEILGRCTLLSGNASGDTFVSSLTYDSRNVQAGSLFVAIKGFSVDGHDFLKQAAEKGAVAAVVENIDETINLAQYRVSDTRQALPQMAAEFYAPEIDAVRKVGITGTNGKTTISYLVKSILETAGIPCGLIGTISYQVGEEIKQAWNTTPESTDLYHMLYQMHQQGQQSCVMEVSSHALSLHRVAGLKFEAAVFSNLTQDHLDFHHDLESYFCAKKRLFDYLEPDGTAILNSDDSYGRRLSEQLDCHQITYGFNETARVYAREYKSDISGIRLTAQTPVGEVAVKSPLIGKFNIENILAALAVGCALHIDKVHLAKGIACLERVSGRLEPIAMKNDRIAVVDYAHTPDALEKALTVLKELVAGNLWVVFGCGGNRDKTKRPLMGAIAQKIADKVVVTSDNPRFEAPDAIIEEIIAGMKQTGDMHVNADRREAIGYALMHSVKGDIILIAGKGHEDYQEIKGVKYPFDDRKTILGMIS